VAPEARHRIIAPDTFSVVSTLGPLVPADETFNHQIVDTFATVSQTDRSWTEKVCAMACARDGSLQLGMGLGKYTNRGVMDAYAGVSRGVEQWTVRASRALSADPDRTRVGPITYEVLEPFARVRFALAENDVLPITFDWVFQAAVPAGIEHHEQHRSRDGYRLDADIVRYHHSGTAVGWCDLEGERIEFDDVEWVSTRDHSWGVRYQVGVPATDVATQDLPSEVAILVIWSPILCERPDGSRYGLHLYYQRHALGDLYHRTEVQGTVEHPDGRVERVVELHPDLRFREDNRRLLGGTLHAVMADGSARPLTIEVLGDTGFGLGAGLYFGFDDHWHGEWRGALHIDGEHLPDCTDPEVARRLHQLRDCVVRVEDPVGGGTGWGNMQTLAAGPHPEMGLTAESSFM
jgi:hypothetical protein